VPAVSQSWSETANRQAVQGALGGALAEFLQASGGEQHAQPVLHASVSPGCHASMPGLQQAPQQDECYTYILSCLQVRVRPSGAGGSPAVAQDGGGARGLKTRSSGAKPFNPNRLLAAVCKAAPQFKARCAHTAPGIQLLML